MSTYLELYNLHETQTTLKARAKVALAKFAAYTLGSVIQSDVDWAKATLLDVSGKVDKMFWEFVSDPAVTGAQDPSTITDAQVQTIVETICRKY